MPNTVITIHVSNLQYNPVKLLNKLDDNLTNYLKKDAAKKLQKDYEETVENWQTKPIFPSRYSETGNAKVLTVIPSGRDQWKWQIISDGTKVRTIYAKRLMVFPRDYTPKTTPAGRYGGPGVKSGPLVYRYSVRHSIAAREFSEKIKTRREEEIINDIEKVVRKSLT